MADITTTFLFDCSISSTGALEFNPQNTTRITAAAGGGWELTLSSEFDDPPGDNEDAIFKTSDFTDGGTTYEVSATSTVGTVQTSWTHQGSDILSPTYTEEVTMTIDITATPVGGGTAKTHTTGAYIIKRGRPLGNIT